MDWSKDGPSFVNSEETRLGGVVMLGRSAPP